LRADGLRRDGIDEPRCDGVGPSSDGASGMSSNELPIDMGRSAPVGSDGVDALAYWNGAGLSAGCAAEPGMSELRRRVARAGATTDSVSGTRRSSLKGLAREHRRMFAHARGIREGGRLRCRTALRSSPEEKAEKKSAEVSQS